MVMQNFSILQSFVAEISPFQFDAHPVILTGASAPKIFEVVDTLDCCLTDLDIQIFSSFLCDNHIMSF